MNVERVELAPMPMHGLREVVTFAELPVFFGRAFASVAAELARRGIQPVGAPISLYHSVIGDKVEVTAGFPIDRAVAPIGDIVADTVPGGLSVETVHIGSYDRLQETYAELTQWMADQGLTPAAEMWEQYIVGPDRESDTAKWRTRIVYPLR